MHERLVETALRTMTFAERGELLTKMGAVLHEKRYLLEVSRDCNGATHGIPLMLMVQQELCRLMDVTVRRWAMRSFNSMEQPIVLQRMLIIWDGISIAT